MNHLAHLTLARDNPKSRIGNLIADEIKGSLESSNLHPEIIRGIRHHRHIDALTDNHPAVAQVRSLFNPPLRRLANPIIDIFFDHFLILSWDKWMKMPLREFIDSTYREIKTHSQFIPKDIAEALDERISRDWLTLCATQEGINKVFTYIARSRPLLASIETAGKELTRLKSQLNDAFFTLYPILQQIPHPRMVLT